MSRLELVLGQLENDLYLNIFVKPVTSVEEL